MKHELPEEWEWKKLGDVADFINGRAFKPSEWEEEGKLIIRIQDLTGSISDPHFTTKVFDTKYLVVKGDLLISWSATLDAFIWQQSEAWLNQHIFKVVEKQEIVNKAFLYYFIKTEINQLKRQTHGSTMKHITKKDFESIKIPVPSLEIQHKIVTVLEKAEETIKLRAQADELTQQFLQSVFLDMFGDPINNHHHLDVGTIADLTIKTQYGTSKKANEEGNGVPILRMNNIDYNGNWDFSSLKHIELQDNEKEKYVVHKGELLFNRTNSKELVGKCAVYREDTPMAFAGYLIKILTDSRATSEFISAHLNSRYGKDYLCNMAKNIVGMANINAKEVQRIPILLPPLHLREEFCSIVDHIQKSRRYQKSSSQEISTLFDSLMQKAFTGELAS